MSQNLVCDINLLSVFTVFLVLIFHADVSEMDVGKRVIVRGYASEGILRFFGSHHESEKLRCGVELDKPLGKNNGSVRGHEYFVCAESHGVLCNPNKVTLLQSSISILENNKSSGCDFEETGFSNNSSLQISSTVPHRMTNTVHNSDAKTKDKGFSNDLYGNVEAENVISTTIATGFRASMSISMLKESCLFSTLNCN